MIGAWLQIGMKIHTKVNTQFPLFNLLKLEILLVVYMYIYIYMHVNLQHQSRKMSWFTEAV